MDSIDKLRKMVSWYNSQQETMCTKIQSVKDAERIYDFCLKHEIEFADNMEFDHSDLYDKLCDKLKYTI